MKGSNFLYSVIARRLPTKQSCFLRQIARLLCRPAAAGLLAMTMYDIIPQSYNDIPTIFSISFATANS